MESRLFSIEPDVHFLWEGECAYPWREVPRLLYDTELIYVSSGSYTLRVAGREWRLTEGSVAIIPPGILHESWTDLGQQATRHCLHLTWDFHPSGALFPKQAFRADEFHANRIHPVPMAVRSHLPLVHQASEPLARLLREMFSLLRGGERLGALLLWPILQQALGGSTCERGEILSYPPAVTAVKNFIDAHYQEPIFSADLTRITKLSRSRIFTLFKHFMGISPADYLTKVRLEAAKRLLSGSTHSIKETAAECGFAATSYFSRIFREKVGVCPSDYRARRAT